MKKKKIFLPEFTGYSINTEGLVIRNDLKLKYSKSATLLTPENHKEFKMLKLKFLGKFGFNLDDAVIIKIGISKLDNLN